MGLTKKELQEVKDMNVSAAKRLATLHMPMHVKKDKEYRQNLHRSIVRMFSGNETNNR